MRFNKIYIEITNICNLNCSYCSKNKRKQQEMTEEEFEDILKKIKNYTKTIYLHVKGEPLGHSKLNKLLNIAKNYNFDVRITTNGTLLKERYHILKKYDNIKQINISLHSENKKINYFKDIFETADLLSKKTTIIYRIWTLNNLKLDKQSKLIIDNIKNYYHLDNNFLDKIFNEKNIKIINNIYLDKDNLFNWPNNIKNNNVITGTCLGTKTHIAILANGDVVPCCLDSNGILKLGNIKKNTLDEILNTSLFKEINNGFKNRIISWDLCKNCNFRKRFK